MVVSRGTQDLRYLGGSFFTVVELGIHARRNDPSLTLKNEVREKHLVSKW